MACNLLIVEDDHRLRKLLAYYFSSADYVIFEAENGQKALDTFASEKIDLVILDIMLPMVNGWTVCRSIRSVSSVPMIILTARSQDDDHILGLELGADDYITKPFSPRVLVARARSLLSRRGLEAEREQVIELEHLRIDHSAHQVLLDERAINLSPREYELLYYLIRNRGQTLSREQILNGVWGYDYYGDFRTVDTHIWRLRDKLGPYQDMISTIRGFGYRFEVKS